jgi:L-lactate dehydrogenase complex protein LldG
MAVFEAVGGQVFIKNNYHQIETHIRQQYDSSLPIATTIPQLQPSFAAVDTTLPPHSYQNLELAILPGLIGVAENGAIWLSDSQMGQNAIPYICQHLAIVIHSSQIVANLHQAYELIQNLDYGFGGFIAGPSKTADIEQALVLGAHGALTMAVFILNN